MKFIFPFIIFICIHSLSISQLIETKWYEGEVFLNNHEKKQGQVKIDFQKNILHFKNDSSSFIFLPSLVNHIKIYSDENNSQRIFSPFKYLIKKYKEDWGFFELLYIGKTTSILALGKGTTTGYNSDKMTYINEVKFTFHVKEPSGNIKLFKASNAHIINLFNNEENKIKKYIKSNSLKCQNFDDLVKVFEYYDQLKANEAGI